MNVAVLGAGAWGTAVACALAPRHAVRLWARDAQQVAAINATRSNGRYLPGHPLPAALTVTSDLTHALERAELVVVGTPTSALRGVLRAVHAAGSTAPLVWLCKGFERDSGQLAHQIVAAELGARPDSGPLSGPSFAEEVVQGLPTALTIAGAAPLCSLVTQIFHAGALRIYSTDDVIGVEVGGSVKNVMAIATGIADALGLGMNARAALMTRGLAETTRLGVALGARAETFTGLTGLGDLILTCTGDLSRNRRIGMMLGAGRSLPDALAHLGHVAEGVWSAPAVSARAAALNVEMPLTNAVCAVLDGGLTPANALQRLLAREPKSE